VYGIGHYQPFQGRTIIDTSGRLDDLHCRAVARFPCLFNTMRVGGEQAQSRAAARAQPRNHLIA
jgi:hypothetical protein